VFANNKKFLYIAGGIFLALIIALLILVIISNKNKDKKNQVRDNILTIWGTSDDLTALDSTITNFQTEHKDVKVVYVKKDSANYLKDSLAEIAAGRGPDVWAVPNDWMVKYHDQMTPMPEKLITNAKEKKSDLEVYQETYPNAIYQDNVFEDKIYGMPLALDMLKLFYNSGILTNTMTAYRKAHPGDQNTNLTKIFRTGPANWDDVITMIDLINQKNGNDISQSTIALGNTANIADSVNILTLMMLQDGAKMTSDDHLSATFQTKQNQFGSIDYPGTTALSFYASFANPSDKNYTWNNSFSDSVRAFAEGKTAMLIDFESKKADIKRINSTLNFGTVSVPQIKETANPVNFASYNTFTVSKAAKDSNLAWQFIALMTENNNVRNYLTVTKKTSAKLSSDPNDQLKTLATWYNPEPEKTPEIFKEMIDQVNGGKNAQTAIENAASQVTTLLGKLKE
jgi:ABC-type glycerol-3-phosphate transport system substrate-binding protein